MYLCSKMVKKIKLIWDFRGPEAKQTAEHHAIHLKEFAIRERLSLQIAGSEAQSELHWLAYLLVEEKDMIAVRDALKPGRGVWVE